MKGSGLVEIIVGSAIISLALLGLMTTFSLSVRVSEDTNKRITAQFLVEEGIEVARMFREASWSYIGNLSTTTPYGFLFSTTTSSWATTTEEEIIDATYYRTLTVTDVFRNGTDDIVSSLGTYDERTKKITVAVSWGGRQGTSTISVDTFLGNIFE